MADPAAQPAVRPRDDVLPPDQPGEPDQPLRDELRVLDDVRGVPGHAGHEGLPVRQRRLLPDGPLVLVPRVGGLHRIATGADRQHQVDEVAQRDVVTMRAVVAAPADVQPDLLFRQPAQRVVERLDAQRRVPAVLRHRHLREHLPAVGQVRVVHLQDQPRVDNGLVLLAQHVSDGEQGRLLVRVELVAEPVPRPCRGNGWQERLHAVVSPRRHGKPLDIGAHADRARIPQRPGTEVRRDRPGLRRGRARRPRRRRRNCAGGGRRMAVPAAPAVQRRLRTGSRPARPRRTRGVAPVPAGHPGVTAARRCRAGRRAPRIRSSGP